MMKPNFASSSFLCAYLLLFRVIPNEVKDELPNLASAYTMISLFFKDSKSLSQLEKRPFLQLTRLVQKRLPAFSISLGSVQNLLILSR
jgi:hypothetical protein